MFHTLEKQAIRQKPKSKKTRTTLCEGTIILGHKISKHVQLVSNTKKTRSITSSFIYIVIVRLLLKKIFYQFSVFLLQLAQRLPKYVHYARR